MRSIKIGITGLPGAGKTITLIKVIQMLEDEGKVVGGMITEPVLENNVRVGFYVMDWITKKKGIMAHKELDTNRRVGKYGVDIDTLEKIGVEAIKRATEEADVIVIDEVGKMEVESKYFVDVVTDVMDNPKPIILTLHKKSRNPLLQEIRRRDDIRILEVTPVNRNLLPYKILKLLKGEGEIS